MQRQRRIAALSTIISTGDGGNNHEGAGTERTERTERAERAKRAERASLR